MSKIYNKYLELKAIDKDKLYLFKSGKFYIFIDKDCDIINEYVVLKKVKFFGDIYKCGFPNNVLDNYLKVFKNHKLNVEIIDEVDSSIESIIKSVDVDNITPIEALIKLKELKDIVK